jgi:aspartyl-tRNA(Asn)/glutamyl-tRNA(Gln) amidotransferase subunit A
MNVVNDGEFTISRLTELIRKRKLSPVELTRALIDRIERYQPDLNAFITITGELALKQARRAEREITRDRDHGLLQGIPICIKDLFHTRGIRTTAGSLILRRFYPRQDAKVVARLLQEGAIIMGKTNLHEFAYGVTNINPHYGPVRNPWDIARMAGGSSGGSAAAVTAALSVGSIGTDTGGSIRIPAAACGCVGLKPTYGSVSVAGVVPLAASLDHVGPLARSVEDGAILYRVMMGEQSAGLGDGFPLMRRGVRGLRIGVPRQYFFHRIQRGVRRHVRAAIDVLKSMGAEIRPVDLRGIKETARLHGEITVAEALLNHWRWFQNREKDYGSDLRTRLRGGLTQTALSYLRAQEDRAGYREAFEEALASVHVLAMPSLPIVAPKIDEGEVAIGKVREDVRLALLRLTRPGNLTGLPAISIPCGFSEDRLPVGLQLMGRPHDEATLLRVAYAYEQATPWHLMFPSDADSTDRGRKAPARRRRGTGQISEQGMLS